MTAPTHLWLRAETKLNEKRSALTPAIAKELLNAGSKNTFVISVSNDDFSQDSKLLLNGAPREFSRIKSFQSNILNII